VTVTVGVGDGLFVGVGVGVGRTITVGVGVGVAEWLGVAEADALPLASDPAGGVASGLNGLRPAGPL
jgi:hypothetical protein